MAGETIGGDLMDHRARIEKHLKKVNLIIDDIEEEDEQRAAKLYIILNIIGDDFVEALGLLETAGYCLMQKPEAAGRSELSYIL